MNLMSRPFGILGLKGKHDKLRVEKSLRTTKIPFLPQPPVTSSSSSSSCSSDGDDDSESELELPSKPDHMQWFRNAMRKMVEDRVVECTDFRSLEIDIQIQLDEYWIERCRGDPFTSVPVACFAR